MSGELEMDKLVPLVNNIASTRTKQEWCLSSISNYEEFKKVSAKLHELEDKYRELEKEHEKFIEEFDKIEELLDEYGIVDSFFDVKMKLWARVEKALVRS
jgi:SMC interacting uncharacterized protein involved in chromosome segregation